MRHRTAIVTLLFLAPGAACLIPLPRGSRHVGLSTPTPQSTASTAVYTPRASPATNFARRAIHIALGWAGSTLLSAQHALAAKKGMVAPPLVAPTQSLAPAGLMLAIFQWAGGIASLTVVLKLMLNNFKTDLNTEITAVKTDLTMEITAVKTDLTKEITAVKTDLTKEITAVKTDLNAVKTELTAVKTDLTKEITKVKTDIVEELSLMFATKLKEIHDDFKASSAAEVERQVKTE